MPDKILMVDIDQCIGCYTCEIACKQENEMGTGPRWCRVLRVGPREIQGELLLDIFPTLCIHCDNPTCVYFCPVGAIARREDGIVLIDKEQCTGCGVCVYGCPYGAILMDEEENIAGKCSLCASRIDYGLEPSCVQHCIGGALQFITEEEFVRISQGTHMTGTSKVRYVSSKWKLAL